MSMSKFVNAENLAYAFDLFEERMSEIIELKMEFEPAKPSDIQNLFS